MNDTTTIYKSENFVVYPLSEGAFTVGKDKKFVPFNMGTDDLQQRSQGSILVEIQPFVVVTKTDTILLDTGLGYCNMDGTMQIHQNLIDIGINPMDVTKVILSHLHKDHSGGISREDKVLNQKNFLFPQAIYYVNKNEFDYGMATGAPSFTPNEFNILASSDRVIFTNDNDVIDDFIFLQHTGAHSPHHQSITIKIDDEIIFFGGDVAPQLNQMRSKFVAKYDFDGKLCMDLRQQWWQQGELEKWVFLFYHDIKTPIFQF